MIPGVHYLYGSLISLALGIIVKGLLWLREVKTNHLPHIQAAVEAIPTALKEQSQTFEKAMEKQTAAMVKAIDANCEEIREQRQDIRLLISHRMGANLDA